MNYNQNHKRKKRIRTSYIWAGVMSVCALAALFIAVWVVITVYEKIAGDSKEWAQYEPTEETTALEIDSEEIFGWITDENGSRFREDDGNFAVNSWKIWDDQLYYLKEDSYMATDEVKLSGQTFSFRKDGALEDIQLDRSWVGLTGDDNLQNLNSLVKSNEFWCYLSSDPQYTGSFKPICYRKTTETREEILGGAVPEFSTPNSMQIHDGYIYFLPQVTAQQMTALSAEEKRLCNQLYRMKPGNTQKELLAQGATGFLVLEDGSVYYAAEGIHKVEEEKVKAVGEATYQVLVQDNGAYLVDDVGKLAAGDENGQLQIDDRIYTLDNGRIKKVVQGEQRINNAVFTLEPDPQDRGKKAIFKQEDMGSKSVFAQAPFGIDSFCIAGGKIYCSAFVAKGEDNTRYSQIYRINPDGSGYEELNGQFEGNIINLYYYPNKQKLYGEYTPASWIGCYGQIVVLGLDGSMKVIDDSASRGNTDKSTNELATLLMVDDTMVTVYLQTCEYSVSGGGWNVLSERPIQFSELVQQDVPHGLPFSGQSGLENSESSASEDEEGENGQSAENGQESNSASSQTSSNERETQPSQSNRNERETQPSQSNRNERETQPSQSNRNERETQPSQAERETQRETTAPPPTTEAAQTGPTIPRPAEPGSQTQAPSQAGPGPENTIPTIEANPEQNTQIGNTPPSQDVQYIGPGSPIG